MRYFPAIKLNESLIGKVPSYFSQHSKHISKRALKILNKRSQLEIKHAAKIINLIRGNKTLEIYTKAAEMKSEGSLPLEADYENYDKLRIPTPAQLLIKELNRYNIKDHKEFPNATYAEYLSVLALILIGQAIENEKFVKNKNYQTNSMEYFQKYGVFIAGPNWTLIKGNNSKANEITLLKLNGALVINAMESICLSEELKKIPHSKELIDSKAKDKISISNQAAAIKRHEPGNKLKIEFIEYFYSNQPISMNKAAMYFAESLKGKKALIFAPTNIGRVLKDALRQYKKIYPNRKL